MLLLSRQARGLPTGSSANRRSALTRRARLPNAERRHASAKRELSKSPGQTAPRPRAARSFAWGVIRFSNDMSQARWRLPQLGHRPQNGRQRTKIAHYRTASSGDKYANLAQPAMARCRPGQTRSPPRLRCIRPARPNYARADKNKQAPAASASSDRSCNATTPQEERRDSWPRLPPKREKPRRIDSHELHSSRAAVRLLAKSQCSLIVW